MCCVISFRFARVQGAVQGGSLGTDLARGHDFFVLANRVEGRCSTRCSFFATVFVLYVVEHQVNMELPENLWATPTVPQGRERREVRALAVPAVLWFCCLIRVRG